MERLKGKEAKCCDRFRTSGCILHFLLFVIIYGSVLNFEWAKFGTVKSQRFDTMKITEYNYTLGNFPLMCWTYYDMPKAMKHVNKLRSA